MNFLCPPSPNNTNKKTVALRLITLILLLGSTASAGPWDDFKKIRLNEPTADKKPAIQADNTISCNTATTRVAQDGQNYLWHPCAFDANNATYTPYGIGYPLIYITPRGHSFSESSPARIRVVLHSANNDSDHFNTVKHLATPDANSVEIHPREQAWQGHQGGHWVFSGQESGRADNYNGQQIAAGIDYVLKTHVGQISIDQGIHLKGQNEGGTGVMHQALTLPRYQSDIAIVEASGGLMRAAKNHRDTLTPYWGTGFFNAVNFNKQRRKAQHIHFHWSGSSEGEGFDSSFIDWCEQYRISCSLAWHPGTTPPAGGNWQNLANLWQNPEQNVTLNQLLPVITNSTANYHGDQGGYHNRGISWSHAKMLDSKTHLRIPLKYDATKHIGAGIPDQPDRVMFSLTPRHVRYFPIIANTQVSWQFGVQQGTAYIDSDNTLTIEKLSLQSGKGYTDLIINAPSTDPSETPTGIPLQAALQYPIVYTRVPRTHGTHSITLSSGEIFTSTNWDFLDALPEVGRIYSQFNAPGQLVLRLPGGNEKVIYDCMNHRRPCVPMDPMPSLDGRKIAFSVYSADGLKAPWPENRKYPNRQLNGSNVKAQIHIYDMDSGTISLWPHSGNNKDISPVWLPDGRIMFASSRSPSYPPKLHRINPHPTQPRLFIADADGNNVQDISPHEITGAMHPFVMTNGRIAYSSHWTSHNLPYVHNNGGINWPGTITNFWNIMEIDRRGGDFMALLGAHKNNMSGSNPKSATIKALHFLGQRANDDLCTVNYYRSNNLGLGDVVCWPLEPTGIEGPTPSFNPRGLYSAATWSTSEDSASLGDKKGGYLGKVGWPEGSADNQLILTVGKGLCTQVATSVPGTPKKLGNNTGCDTGLYKTTRIPSQSIDDLAKIVDLPQWHEFGAREVRSRDIAVPELSNTSDGTCITASADAGSTDAHNYRGYRFNNNYGATSNNGAEIHGLPHSELAAIRFYKVLPLSSSKDEPHNSIGNRVELLGDVPLLADKSFTAQLPCDTPYLMVGIDKQGRAIKRDQVPQSLRPGEKRVCGGCHLHSKKGRPYEVSLAFHTKPRALLTSTRVPTYTRDIQPLLQKRCGSCHSDDVPINDYDKLVWDFFQTHVPEDRKRQVSKSTNVKRRYGLQRPYSSKYVNTMYARESLLYWKAANKRSDGRRDDTYPDDIDFGTNHPTNVTASELKLIGDWLDSGATR